MFIAKLLGKLFSKTNKELKNEVATHLMIIWMN
jgi:hypothetical protein